MKLKSIDPDLAELLLEKINLEIQRFTQLIHKERLILTEKHTKQAAMLFAKDGFRPYKILLIVIPEYLKNLFNFYKEVTDRKATLVQNTLFEVLRLHNIEYSKSHKDELYEFSRNFLPLNEYDSRFNEESYRGFFDRTLASYGGKPSDDDWGILRETNNSSSVGFQVGLHNYIRDCINDIKCQISKFLLIESKKTKLVTPDKNYTPSTTRREAGKLNTQAMYKSWQKEYRKLKKKHPNMTYVWYSKQIAKLDIAKNRDSETIRNKMIK